ncbi:hypothetical protein [Chromobacterium subtsugae]|uniref:hypothetical protein n=1 Tax=Chromobacterium subtsugae TaxID=251747 RepID=UPI000ABBC076|nr:hypothetical protein [Chromobacterium subtsugae]
MFERDDDVEPWVWSAIQQAIILRIQEQAATGMSMELWSNCILAQRWDEDATERYLL